MQTRRAPSRHCTGRDARVYGHTATAMHDGEYTPPTRDTISAALFLLFKAIFLRNYFVPTIAVNVFFVSIISR